MSLSRQFSCLRGNTHKSLRQLKGQITGSYNMLVLGSVVFAGLDQLGVSFKSWTID